MAKKMSITKSNPFAGCTIVVTGRLEHFTRNDINSKIVSLGAIAGSSVSRRTDYLICGEKPGSKLTKARELGVPVLIEPDCREGVRAQLERMKELCKERNSLYEKQNDLKGQKYKIEKSLE